MSVAACDDDCNSSTAAETDLCISNNVTWADAFQFTMPDDPTWTLTGHTFALDVKVSSYDSTPLLSLTSANGRIVIDDPIQRVIHLLVAPADIQAALDPGEYVYDLVMLDGSTPPVRTALMYGTLDVNQGVTNSP